MEQWEHKYLLPNLKEFHCIGCIKKVAGHDGEEKRGESGKAEQIKKAP